MSFCVPTWAVSALGRRGAIQVDNTDNDDDEDDDYDDDDEDDYDDDDYDESWAWD